MPIPLLAGIPWLAAIIGSLFTAVFTWIAQYWTKRVAVVAAVVLVIIALTVAFFAALQALIVGIGFVVPGEVSQAAGHFLPSNTQACVTAMLTARTLRYAYDWNIRIIQFKLF